MTDEDFAAWLSDDQAIPVTLLHLQARVAGVETTRRVSSVPFTTAPTDVPADTAYSAIAPNGIRYSERISLTGGSNLVTGDIELNNEDGSIDGWVDDIWVNREVVAYLGDIRWALADFRVIFNGVAADIVHKGREKLALKVRDKLQRLNTPVSEEKLGGTSTNSDMLIPIPFGEVHNMTPLLKDPATLEFKLRSGPIERIIEVRDNGKPVGISEDLAAGEFTLDNASFGAITVSVQGDKPSDYPNTIAPLIRRIVTGFGKVADRFTEDDIDDANFDAFEAAFPQAVGILAANRENCLGLCMQLADSVRAQLVMSSLGKLRLIQVALPGFGTPFAIGEGQMRVNSLRPVERTTVVAAVKVGYCKNWTLQPGLQTTIPEEHKNLFKTEWLTKTATDSTVQSAYRLSAEPPQRDTMLLAGADAQAEAERDLAHCSVQHHVFQFDGTPPLLMLELGQAVTLTNRRFRLAEGQDGMVVMREVWSKNRSVTMGVLV